MFCGLVIAWSVLIFAKKPVRSVFSLIILYIYASIICFYFNVEFLALLLCIIYVGALAILFLFCIMMVGANTQWVKQNEVNNFNFFFKWFFFLTSLKIFSCFYKTFWEAMSFNFFFKSTWVQIVHLGHQVYLSNDIYLFGYLLYTNYGYLFLLISAILLVSMIGSIFLCLNFYFVKKKYNYL